MSTTSLERINFQIPAELSGQLKEAASKLNLSLSEFIRIAIQKFIQEETQKRLDKELEEGYKANYAYYKSQAEEYKHLNE